MKAVVLGTVIYAVIMFLSAILFIYTNDFNKSVVFAIVSSIVWMFLIWTVKALSDNSSNG